MPDFHILEGEPRPRPSPVLKINNCHTLAQQEIQKWGIKTHIFKRENVKFSHPGRGTPSQTHPRLAEYTRIAILLHNKARQELCITKAKGDWKTHIFKGEMSNFLTLGGEPPPSPTPVYQKSIIFRGEGRIITFNEVK